MPTFECSRFSEIIKKLLVKLRPELNLAPGLMPNKHLAVTGARIPGLVVNAIGIRVLLRW